MNTKLIFALSLRAGDTLKVTRTVNEVDINYDRPAEQQVRVRLDDGTELFFARVEPVVIGA